MKNTQSKIKPTKIEKNLEQHIVLGVKIIRTILARKSENDKQSAQRKISLCCLLIK